MRTQSPGTDAPIAGLAVVAVWAACFIGFWAAVIYVVLHFIGKFW